MHILLPGQKYCIIFITHESSVTVKLFMYKLLLLFRARLSTQAPRKYTAPFPSVSNNKIAFAYGGDIWTHNRDGSNPNGSR